MSTVFPPLGFALPACIRDVAMQKARLYYELEALTIVIEKYKQSVISLSPSETFLMKRHLLDMERHILPGLTRVTWTALGIGEYIEDITKGWLHVINATRSNVLYFVIAVKLRNCIICCSCLIDRDLLH